MSKVLIIVNAEVPEGKGLITTSPVTQTMVNALKQAIRETHPLPEIEVIATASLWSNPQQFKNLQEAIFCPLSIQIPHWLDFPAQKVYQACQQTEHLRHWVKEQTNHRIRISGSDKTLGDFWLPVVLTDKGPLYGEVIREGEIPNFYQQPIDLKDKVRQPLYSLAYQLFEYLDAPPSVYLLQFSLLGQSIVFDRLWPFLEPQQ